MQPRIKRKFNTIPVSDRFWSKVEKTESCWLWTGSKNNNKYGNFWVGNGVVKAHRWAYEQLNGKIAEGLLLDHLCRNVSCVNPKHLEPVTNRENIRRAIPYGTLGRYNRRKSFCKQGHKFDDKNTLVSGGQRVCRACRNYRRRLRYHRLKIKANSLKGGDV